MPRLLPRLVFLLSGAAVFSGIQAQPAAKRLLYVTHSAGFVHGSIGVSRLALAEVGARAGVEVVATEDLSYFDPGRLDGFDAVFFFTSGELPLSAPQKENLLAFVRSGKGFGGAHSATDTLYQWAEYGELIGAYFDGHPWVHEATVEIEDPEHPVTRGLPGTLRMVEEFYQFRAFSRDKVRVLMTLDPASIDLRLPGVNRTDEDFALAWVRPYGEGRVFYTALGHFDETWRDRRFQTMLEGALRYLTGQTPEAASAPRRSLPAVARLGNPAVETNTAIAPGMLLAITGTGLSTGSSMNAAVLPLPVRLAGTQVRIANQRAPLVSVSPNRIVALVPPDVPQPEAVVEVLTGGGLASPARFSARVESASPGILGVLRFGRVAALYCTGLASGDVAVQSEGGGGSPLVIEYSGLAPGLAGVQQVNVRLPEDPAVRVRVVSAGRESNWIEIPKE